MKKICMTLTAALLALTMLAGCTQVPVSEPTDTATVGTETVTVPVLDAEGVYEKMSEAVAGRTATSFTSTTEMGAGVNAAMLSLGGELSAVTQIRLAEEPFAFHSDTDMSASLFGLNISESFQIYSQTNDAGLTNYFHIEGADKWIRNQLVMVPTDLLGQYTVTACPSNWQPWDLTLEQQAEGTYVLSGIFSAEDVLHAISSPIGEISLEGMDLTGVQLATTYYVDAATFLPTRIEIEFRGLGEVIGDLFNQYAGQLLGGFGANVSVEVESYREVLSDLSYAAAEVPVVPEEGVSSSTDIADFNILEYLQVT